VNNILLYIKAHTIINKIKWIIFSLICTVSVHLYYHLIDCNIKLEFKQYKFFLSAVFLNLYKNGYGYGKVSNFM